MASQGLSAGNTNEYQGGQIANQGMAAAGNAVAATAIMAAQLAAQNYIGAAITALKSGFLRKVFIFTVLIPQLLIIVPIMLLPGIFMSFDKVVYDEQNLYESYQEFTDVYAGKITRAYDDRVETEKKALKNNGGIIYNHNNTYGEENVDIDIQVIDVGYDSIAEATIAIIMARYSIAYAEIEGDGWLGGAAAWAYNQVNNGLLDAILWAKTTVYANSIFKNPVIVDKTEVYTEQITIYDDDNNVTGYETVTKVRGTVEIQMTINLEKFEPAGLTDEESLLADDMAENLILLIKGNPDEFGGAAAGLLISEFMADPANLALMPDPIPVKRFANNPFGAEYNGVEPYCDFGWRILYGKENYHWGFDFSFKAKGDPIYASYDAVVVGGVSGVTAEGNREGGYGNYIALYHGMYNGEPVFTLYAHATTISVPLTTGYFVSQGTKIATNGNTGNSTGPHVHFEVIVNGNKVNPRGYMIGY